MKPLLRYVTIHSKPIADSRRRQTTAWRLSRQSKYASLAAPKFSFLALPTIANLGDALREVDQMEIFRGEDILLVRGPLVASLALDPVELIERHRKRKTADQTIIMSSLYAPQPASPASLVLSPSRKLIHLQSHGPLRISLDLLAERGAPNGFQVLSGHAPSGIEVVSMHVPALFTENFDHEKLYEDLVPEVLDSEVLNHAFYVDVTKSGEFVKRIDSTSGLLEVSLDVLARKSYPLVPDVDWLGSGEVSQFDAKSGCYGPNPTSSTT